MEQKDANNIRKVLCKLFIQCFRELNLCCRLFWFALVIPWLLLKWKSRKIESRVIMSLSTSSRETSGLSGKQNQLFPSRSDLKCIMLKKKKKKKRKRINKSSRVLIRSLFRCTFSPQNIFLRTRASWIEWPAVLKFRGRETRQVLLYASKVLAKALSGCTPHYADVDGSATTTRDAINQARCLARKRLLDNKRALRGTDFAVAGNKLVGVTARV